MDYVWLIGLLGIIGIAVSWLPQTMKVLKEKRTDMSLGFVVLYMIGSILLLVYSIMVRDAIYIALNTFTTLLASINLYYAAKKTRS